MIRFAEDDNILCPLCCCTGPDGPLREFDLVILTGDDALCHSHNDEVEEMLGGNLLDEDASALLELLLDEEPRDDSRPKFGDLHEASDGWDVA